MTKTEAISLLRLVSAVMPNLKIDFEQTGFAWSIIMPDITYETGARALVKVLRKKTIPTLPTPAEIIEAAKEVINVSKEAGVPDVYSAWDEVRSKLGCVSSKEIQWSHPNVKKTVLSIGAHTIATATYDIFPRFAKVYDGFLKRGESRYENKLSQHICDKLEQFMQTKVVPAPRTLKSIADEQMMKGIPAGSLTTR